MNKKEILIFSVELILLFAFSALSGSICFLPTTGTLILGDLLGFIFTIILVYRFMDRLNKGSGTKILFAVLVGLIYFLLPSFIHQFILGNCGI